MPWCVAQIHPPRLVPNSPSFCKCWQSIFSTESPTRLALAEDGPRLDFALSDEVVLRYKSPAPLHQLGSVPSSQAPLGFSLCSCGHYTTVQLLLPCPASFTPTPHTQCWSWELYTPKFCLPANLHLEAASQRLQLETTVPWLREWALEPY